MEKVFCKHCDQPMDQYDSNGNEFWNCRNECHLTNLFKEDENQRYLDYFDMIDVVEQSDILQPEYDELQACDEDYISSYYDSLLVEIKNNKNDLQFQSEKEMHFERLKKYYKVKETSNTESNPVLYYILSLLEQGEEIHENFAKWLYISKNNQYLGILCKVYHDKFEKGKNSYSLDIKKNAFWNLTIACKFYRKRNMPEKVIKLTENLSCPNKKVEAALFTTRGGAFRDLKMFDIAVDHAEKAIQINEKLHKKKPHPYNLLGGLCMDLGRYEKGFALFTKAQLLGYDETKQDKEIKSMLQDGLHNRHEMADFLIQTDPNRFGWVRSLPM
jgi:hypothetical protein